MIAPGDRIRRERDETRYPPNGTWPQFRGRSGTVVSIHAGEIGVCFEKVHVRRNGGLTWKANSVYWFQPHEVVRAALSATLTDEIPREAA